MMTKSSMVVCGLAGALAFASAAHAAQGTIRLSSIGFRQGSVKTATFLKGGRFTVRRTTDGLPVFSAPLDHAVDDAILGQTVYIGDFSSVRAKGTYYLELSNCERSAAFPISRDVYVHAYESMMLGFYGQRCGARVSLTYDGTEFGHDACHTDDVDLSFFDATDQPRALLGGWHDAGDYGRYTVNGGFTAGLVLRAWEDYSSELGLIALSIPETGGATPDFLVETRWQLEWLLKMEYADGSGRFSNALKSQDFPAFVMPEDDSSPIALASASSMGTAIAGAVLAQASRVYRPYDAAFADECEQAALRAYDFVTSNPDVLKPSEEWAAAYDDSDPPGDGTAEVLDAAARLWAAAEVWATTGESAALSDVEARAKASSYAFSSAPDWVDPSDLGIITYLRSDSKLRDSAVVEGLSSAVLDAAATLKDAHDAADNGWGRAQDYWWGANGTVARSCLVLKMAERVDGSRAHMDLCAEQIGHLMGRNLYGRSQVTGVGTDPPIHPHHRPSGADDIIPPWPGLLIGGPRRDGTQWVDWIDDQDAYDTNETAINWNAALVYAFASFLGDDPGAPSEDEDDQETLDAGAVECVPDPDAGTSDASVSDAATDGPDVINTPTGDGAVTQVDGGSEGGAGGASSQAGADSHDDASAPPDVDAGSRDDAGQDARDASTDASKDGDDSGGCGCRISADRSMTDARGLGGVALLLFARRRRVRTPVL